MPRAFLQNYLFNLDDWSDQYDTEGTKGLASCVMNVLYHPDIYDSDANTPQATLARRYVLRYSHYQALF